MSITVRSLLELPLGLKAVAGADGVERSVRWVHVSELQDPTPWLRGGELLLTTGMGIGETASQQAAYIRRLVEADLSALGFGVGFGFTRAPAALRQAADAAGFPLLEVPYEVPFVAISEAVSTQVADERYREAQLSLKVNERLAVLVAEGAGADEVLEEVADMTGGWAILFDRRGEPLGRTAMSPDASVLWEKLPEGVRSGTGPQTSTEVAPEGSRVALSVTAGKRHEGVFTFGKNEPLSNRDRIVMQQAATVLGLILAARRAVVETERRVAGDVIEEAFAGRLTGDELVRRLELVGFERGARVTAVVAEVDGWLDAERIRELAWLVDGALGKRSRSVRTTVVRDRIAALVAVPDPARLISSAHAEMAHAVADLGAGEGDLRIGVGEPVEPAETRRSYLSAVFALKAAAPGTPVATPSDLGSYAFLLASQSRPVLEGFVRSVIGPLLDRDDQKASDLCASVKAFIEAGGRWEHGAELLGVHRHTLRYRIRQIEQLLGRNLGDAEDRMEIWLALKASEVLGE